MRSAPASTEEQKIAYLTKYEAMIRSTPAKDVDTLLKIIGAEMLVARLYSGKTCMVDIVNGLRRRCRERSWIDTSFTKRPLHRN